MCTQVLDISCFMCHVTSGCEWSWLCIIKPYLSLYHFPQTLFRHRSVHAGYSIFLSAPLGSSMSCECQIPQALFPHQVTRTFQLSLSNSNDKCLFCFRVAQMFRLWHPRHSFVEPHFCVPQVYPLFVGKLSSIPRHGRGLILRSSSANVSWFLGFFLVFLNTLLSFFFGFFCHIFRCLLVRAPYLLKS